MLLNCCCMGPSHKSGSSKPQPSARSERVTTEPQPSPTRTPSSERQGTHSDLKQVPDVSPPDQSLLDYFCCINHDDNRLSLKEFLASVAFCFLGLIYVMINYYQRERNLATDAAPNAVGIMPQPNW